MNIERLQDKIGQRLGIESYIFASEYLKLNKRIAKSLPIPEAKFYYRGPKSKIIPFTDPTGLWLPLSCAYSLIANVASGGPVNGTTTAAIDTSGANLIVASVNWFNGITIDGIISDSKSNSWTPLTLRTSGSQSGRQHFVSSPSVGSGHTFSFTGTTIAPALCVSAWSGAAASPFDQESGSAGVASSQQPGSITPSENNCLLTTDHGTQTSTNSTVDGGFTRTDMIAFSSGVNESGAQAYLIQATAAAANPTWTDTGSSNSTSTMAAWKAGGGVSIKQLAALGVG